MSIYYKNHTQYKKGITYGFPYNTPVYVSFTIPVAKKYDLTYRNDEFIRELYDKVGAVRVVHDYMEPLFAANGELLADTRPATRIWCNMYLPFKYAEVLAYSYRKHLTRATRRILKYKLENIDFIAQHVVDRVNADFYKCFGMRLE